MSEKPLTFIKRDDLLPICPHCEKELTEVHTRSKGFPIAHGTNVVYFCPHCRKIIGFGQGRML